jgi:hypothetical protein
MDGSKYSQLTDDKKRLGSVEDLFVERIESLEFSPQAVVAIIDNKCLMFRNCELSSPLAMVFLTNLVMYRVVPEEKVNSYKDIPSIQPSKQPRLRDVIE